MGLFSKKNKKPCCICGSEKGLMPSIEGENFCTACNCKYIDFSENILKVTSIMKMMSNSEGMKKFIEVEKKNLKLLEKFTETKSINSSISFDEEQNLLKISYKNRNQILVEKIIKFDDILEFELLEDGETIVKGGIGRVSTENGSFGKGCSAKDSTGEGGGGGWFGGAGMNGAGAGGGGSGYVLTKDSYKPTGYTPTSEYYFDNVVMESGGNTAGAYGYAKITLLQALPFLTVSSYNSITATFKADHTDPTLLTKIEYFIDDVLKETITTDLTTEKTINYTLEDNALHTLKIVVTDSNNATAEKVLSISKNIMPLPEDVNLQDISSKLIEVNAGFKTGKTSIINTLALKNIEANLNNTLVELSEKIKTGFDSSDATAEQLQNQITNLNNQLSQRKRWAKGTYTFTQSDYENFYSRYSSAENYAKSLTVPINLNFIPSLVIVEKLCFYGNGYTVNFYAINNLNQLASVGRVPKSSGEYRFCAFMFVKTITSKEFSLYTYRDEYTDSSSVVYRCKVGESFTWYAYE